MLPVVVPPRTLRWMVVVALSLLASSLTISMNPRGHRHGGSVDPTGAEAPLEDRRVAASDGTAADDRAPAASCPHSKDCHCSGLHMAALLGAAPTAALPTTLRSQVLRRCDHVTALGRPPARTAWQPRAPPRFA